MRPSLALLDTHSDIPLPQHCIALTEDLAASVLRLNNAIVFSKVASALEPEAVFFHVTRRTQCIAYSSESERPGPGDGDAQVLVLPEPFLLFLPARLSGATATAKRGAAV